jgi:hypothetical protein
MKSNEQTDAAMVPIVGDRRVTLPVVGRRVGNASPALEESNEDMLNPDQLTATFDYVLGQTNNQFTCNQFTTCDSTATEEGGKREEAFALLEMADLQLEPPRELSANKNNGRQDNKLSLFFKYGRDLDDGTPVRVVPSLMFRMDGRTPGVGIDK